MNRTILATAAISTLLMTGAALANDRNINNYGYDFGTVTQFDGAGGSITLANGHTYEVMFADEVAGLRVGEKVGIMFRSDMALSIQR